MPSRLVFYRNKQYLSTKKAFNQFQIQEFVFSYIVRRKVLLVLQILKLKATATQGSRLSWWVYPPTTGIPPVAHWWTTGGPTWIAWPTTIAESESSLKPSKNTNFTNFPPSFFGVKPCLKHHSRVPTEKRCLRGKTLEMTASPVTPSRKDGVRCHQKPSTLGDAKGFYFFRYKKNIIQNMMELKPPFKKRRIQYSQPLTFGQKNPPNLSSGQKFLSETNGRLRDQNWNTTPYPKKVHCTFPQDKK